MDWRMFFMNPAVVWVLIPVAAILIGGIQALAKMYFSHQERIAMIEQGIHPDDPPVQQPASSRPDWG